MLTIKNAYVLNLNGYEIILEKNDIIEVITFNRGKIIGKIIYIDHESKFIRLDCSERFTSKEARIDFVEVTDIYKVSDEKESE